MAGRPHATAHAAMRLLEPCVSWIRSRVKGSATQAKGMFVEYVPIAKKDQMHASATGSRMACLVSPRGQDDRMNRFLSRLVSTASRARVLATTPAPIAILVVVGLSGCGSKEPAKPLREEIGYGTIEQAERWLANNRLDKASEAAKKLLIREPNNPRVILLAANLKAADDKLDEAVEMLQGVSSDDPAAYVAALGQSADWLLTLERWEEAEEKLEQILSLLPDATIAHRRLAELLNRQGRRQEAAEHVRKLCQQGRATDLELHSILSVPVAYYDKTGRIPGQSPIGTLADARIALAEGDVQRALETLDRVPSDQQVSAAQQALHGRLLMLNQRVEHMPAWLARCDQQAQSMGDFWFAIGAWMNWQQRYDEAIAAFSQAIRLEPTDRVAYRRLAECLARSGQAEAAEWCIERSQTIESTFELAYEAGSSDSEDPQQLQRLAKAIDDLDRPYESLMWHQIAAELARVPPRVFQQLDAERQNLNSGNMISAEAHLPPSLRLSEGDAPDLDFLADLPRDNTTPSSRSDDRVVRGQAALINIAESVGLRGRYLNRTEATENLYLLHTGVGGGVAVIDYDLDGHPDLYFPQGASEPDPNHLDDWRGSSPNEMYRNFGDQFDLVTEMTLSDDRGYGQGVTSGDANADGFPDLLIANIGHNRLLINNGDGTFREGSEIIRNEQAYWTTSVAIADINGDHLADFVEANYVGDPEVFRDPMANAAADQPPPAASMPRPIDFRSAPDRVFIRRADGSTDAQTLKPNPGSEDGTALALIVTNIDGRSGNEMFVANDMRANQLWSLAADGASNTPKFIDSAIVSGCAYSNRGNATACMGVAAADFNRDGMIDLAVSNFYREPMCFYQQTSPGFFADVAARVNLFTAGNSVNGFGTQPIDYDNNGHTDLVVINGHIYDNENIGIPFRMRPQLFDGSEDSFALVDSVDDSSGYWQQPVLGRTLATLDWNRDGRMDFVVTHLDQSHALIENRTVDSGNWLQLRLVGTESERDAIGSTIELTADGQTWLGAVITGDGFQCKNEPLVSFGVGAADKIEKLSITWPTGRTQTLDTLQVNRRYLIIEGDEQAFEDRSIVAADSKF